MRRGVALLAACAFVGAASIALAQPLPAVGTVEVAFTPWDDAEGLILRSLREARRSVRMQAYILSSRTIAAALQEAQSRGVDVRILADREMAEQSDHSLVPLLAAAGIPVRLETRYSVAHNKVMVIDSEGDQPLVLTGSYNYTWSAQARNAENLLALRGNLALAEAYRINWQRHWDEAQPYAGVSLSGGSARRDSERKAAQSPCAFLTGAEKRLLAGECKLH
ncbi:MAG: phospholipase D family protein [Rhodocyclaceae bacterium]|nr:phospholipase D family protein [Rhodocyclaceae bacterium]